MSPYMTMMLSIIEVLEPASVSDNPYIQGMATIIIAFLGVMVSTNDVEIRKVTAQVIKSAEAVGLIEPGQLNISIEHQINPDDLTNQLFKKVKRG
jgi:hypothetical protein